MINFCLRLLSMESRELSNSCNCFPVALKRRNAQAQTLNPEAPESPKAEARRGTSSSSSAEAAAVAVGGFVVKVGVVGIVSRSRSSKNGKSCRSDWRIRVVGRLEDRDKKQL